jgi:putative membrane protein
MLDIQDFPHIIAALNTASVVALSFGYFFIRSGDKIRHRAAMITALGLSSVFLVFYVIYKANSGFAKFGGEGLIRPVYFTILIVHIMGAISLVPLVPRVVFLALKERFDEHRRIARWTWPLWMFVGISGVVVYVMAVHLYPHAAV